ncbi:MAG: hypothetical protein CMF69_09150 [Magnetovibrio sp.]|nr:hypothetical protein [Magnetovibrio sp.]|tara:strand:- start:584 stop:874 length:291 start_codon:yes stop_codon:yes gene_type:complete
MTRKKKTRVQKYDGRSSPEKLMEMLSQQMEACPDAGSLNDHAIIPFVAALEKVCGARGYVLNIFGETSNLIFTGNESYSREIYNLVEKYLDEIDTR